MRTVNLYEWWSAGKGDGDGREAEMEVTDEQYIKLSEYECEELDNVYTDDPELNELCQNTYDELIKELIDDSSCGWDYVKEEYAIEPDDPEFWECPDEDPEGDYMYKFLISVEQGDSYIEFPLTKEEKEIVYKSIEEGLDLEEVDELSCLFERVKEATKEKLQEDLNEVGNEIDIDDIEYSLSLGELPSYETRYTCNFEEHFKEIYNIGIRIDDNFEEVLECEKCGKKFIGEPTDLGEMANICYECLENEYVKCDKCGKWNDPNIVEHHYLEDGRCICDDCFVFENDEQ